MILLVRAFYPHIGSFLLVVHTKQEIELESIENVGCAHKFRVLRSRPWLGDSEAVTRGNILDLGKKRTETGLMGSRIA